MESNVEHSKLFLISAANLKTSRKRKLTEFASSDINEIAVLETPSGGASQSDGEEKIPEPSSKYFQLSTLFRLDSFSDEVLFKIFKYLDGITLQALGRTCTRFCCLIQDHRFWRHMDFSTQELSLETIRKWLQKSHFNTKSIKVRSYQVKDINVASRTKFSKALAKCFREKCINLQVLELFGVFIDFRYIQISNFPKSLKRLILSDCCVHISEDVKSIFCGIDTHLETLEELRIENNDWFDPLFIMTFSKMPELKLLSLRGCQGLLEFVPYGSMAARFGFKKLECLDVGNTPIRDSDIQCFNSVLTLKELYLECPEHLQSFESDKGQTAALAEMTSTSTSRLKLRSQGIQCPISSSTVLTSSSARNSPSYNSFSARRHRPDQIIYLDVHNSRPAIFTQHNILPHLPTNTVEPEIVDHVDEVLTHPMFWDLINPIGRRFNAMSHNGNCNGQCCPRSEKFRSTYSPITDRGICCFGRPQRPVEQGTIWVRIVNRPSENRFERLSIRHYTLVTDITLQHLVQCSPHLTYLDLTGTSVTREGVQVFKRSKPGCQIVANHLTGWQI